MTQDLQSQWTLHIDGSASPNPGRMAVGAWLRAPDGQEHTLSQPLKGSGCNNEAELRALLIALPWAVALGAHPLLICTDSRLLVEHLTPGGKPPHARLRDLVETAQRMMDEHPMLTLQWVPRHRTGQADALARSALGMPPKPVKTPHPTRRP
jgi:ribonuclease HI